MNRAGSFEAGVRQFGDGVLALAAGLLLLITWYLPWFTMYFHGATPSSPPLDMSPAGLARYAGSAPTAWILLGVGLGMVLLGGGALLTRHAARQIAWCLAAGALLLLITSWHALGEMGVVQTLFGHVAPGVTVVPDTGVLWVCVALGCAVGASVLAGRRAREAGR